MTEQAADQPFEWIDEAANPDAGSWSIRPVMLAVIGAVAAFVIHHLVDGASLNAVTERYSIAIGLGTAATLFGFTAERLRLWWAIIFALLLGVAAGWIFYWQGIPGGSPNYWNWPLTSLFLAIAVMAPLFQTARDEGAWRFPYAELHGHAWTNVVLWFASWAFTGIVFAMSWLLAALFNLVKIDFLEKLLQKEWFIALLFGAAFGGAVGLLRERDRIVRTLQRVVTAVLGVLAPVLGVGLLIFLLLLPFTGLGALWEATRSTTPILLSCVIGALILANAVIGNGPEDEAANPVLRFGAMALGLVMLPLVVIAAIATGLRISQYGFTPDRLWALTFIVMASAYGLAYLVSLARGRMTWGPLVRSSNSLLAFAVAAVALFLATPILSFNAISTDDQVARLTSGMVVPEKFDWAALAFDFGEPGRAALKRLAGSKSATIASKAKSAAAKSNRYEVDNRLYGIEPDRTVPFTATIDLHPANAALPEALRAAIFDQSGEGPVCFGANPCRVYLQPGGRNAVVVRDECAAPGVSVEDRVKPGVKCTVEVKIFILFGATWKQPESMPFGILSDPKMTLEQESASLRAERAAIERGDVTIKPAPMLQAFVGGKPVGGPFLDCSLEANKGRC